MALVINTNVPALTAQRNLETSGINLNRALQRLSSGLRINNAADDAAGLAISTRLGAQIRGLNQAIRNANDGISILQTAEGALTEITSIITRIKELAVQSANGTNSTKDRGSLNSEMQSLISEVTRIATQTKFGSTAILDGSFSAAFQVGTEAGQTVSATVANYKASALAGSVASQDLSFSADLVAAGTANADAFLGIDSSADLKVDGPNGSAFARLTTAADDIASFLKGSTSGIAIAKVVNEISSSTGVVATVQATSFTTAGVLVTGAAYTIGGPTPTHTLSINGQNITVSFAAGDTATQRQQLVISAVNSQVSGVTAAANGATGVDLVAADGRNISVAASTTVALDLFGYAAAVGTESVVARGNVRLQAAGAITTSVADALQVGGEGATAATSTALISLDVTTVTSSTTTLLVVDALLDTISAGRGDLGALQNRLNSTVANLGVVSDKVSEARSRILDADFAAETAALTKGQILQQAGIAILAQANSQPQAVLTLLRGQ